MAMELRFWVADGPNGELLDFATRVQAWQIVPTIERFRRSDHVYIILQHTSRRRGAWIIWVKPGYVSGTCPVVGKIGQV